MKGEKKKEEKKKKGRPDGKKDLSLGPSGAKHTYGGIELQRQQFAL